MERFTVLHGTAAPLMLTNVNTDVLIRIERLIALPRGALGPYCFEALRYRPDGSDDPDFLLNQAPFRTASILLAGANFGCGSSREPAVWALWDMGVRCVIAPGFGDIFLNNCFQNGMLPVVLPQAIVESLAAQATDGAPFTVDLEQQLIVAPSGVSVPFEVDRLRRQAMLAGQDEIGMTLGIAAEIAAFQDADAARRPWIYRF